MIELPIQRPVRRHYISVELGRGPGRGGITVWHADTEDSAGLELFYFATRVGNGSASLESSLGNSLEIGSIPTM